MTFEDFGLNSECNLYQNVTKTPISNGIEYAAKTIEDDTIVFIVGIDMNTICFTKKKMNADAESKVYMTGTYIDATDFYVRKRTYKYKTVGAWMADMIHEQNVYRYGIIIENPDGSYQIIK
ncbi:MAG: hypothetical protein IKO36_02580 [Bacteroidaceae bacterium]|nr:hypothetical protein [Bacteroidaceae bacterium]